MSGQLANAIRNLEQAKEHLRLITDGIKIHNKLASRGLPSWTMDYAEWELQHNKLINTKNYYQNKVRQAYDLWVKLSEEERL